MITARAADWYRFTGLIALTLALLLWQGSYLLHLWAMPF